MSNPRHGIVDALGLLLTIRRAILGLAVEDARERERLVLEGGILPGLFVFFGRCLLLRDNLWHDCLPSQPLELLH